MKSIAYLYLLLHVKLGVFYNETLIKFDIFVSYVVTCAFSAWGR